MTFIIKHQYFITREGNVKHQIKFYDCNPLPRLLVISKRHESSFRVSGDGRCAEDIFVGTVISAVVSTDKLLLITFYVVVSDYDLSID